MRRYLGAVLAIAGVLLVAISIFQSLSQGHASYGGVILIGPIPIIFGSSPEMAIESMVLAIALMVVSLAFMTFWRRQT
ncbi:MAG TPA: DUF131 domain-containing protein [Methanotrichaceae archaeon]|nr:DUF131 domain-containing protein [Methanotrichaceae archaeon]